MSYNTAIVLVGTGLLGMAGGVVGTFAVLRGRSLVGDAVAHSALPGLTLGFMLVGTKSFPVMLAGAAISGMFGMWLIGWLSRNTRIKADAATGAVLSVLFGLGLVMSSAVQNDPSGSQAGLDSFLLGKTAGMISSDVFTLAIVGAVVVALVGLMFKEFKLAVFDSAFAKASGLPVALLDTILMAMIVATTVVGLPAVGVVLMAALLVIPGASARFWSNDLGQIVVLAGAFGAISGVVGTLGSATWSDVPAGAVIVLTGAGIFMISMLFAPERGILHKVVRNTTFSIHMTRDHILKALIESAETGSTGMSQKSLAKAVAGPGLTIQIVLALMQLHKLVETRNALVFPTATGRDKGIHLVKAHRLWEFYLINEMDIAKDHVHRDADELEHVLSPEIVAELERRLALENNTVLPSAHPVGEDS